MSTAHSAIDRLLPFLRWRHELSAASLRADLTAGLTVALLMIPQSLAYAQLAGLPAYYGLYASLLPTMVGALFGSLAQISTGPTPLTGLLTAASVMTLAAPGSPHFIAVVVALALLSGLVQLTLGALRLGWILNLLSHPVLMGFINAAALLICLSQLPSLLGLSMPHGPHFLLDVVGFLGRLDQIRVAPAAFGIGALIALMLLRRLAPRLPGVLLVIAGSIGLSAWSGAADLGVRVVGAIPAGLPEFAIPDIRWPLLVELLPTAFVIALVGFMEVASNAKLISAKTHKPWNENQELIGQGLAKVAASISGTHPVSASFSRSAVNFAAGARTGLSSFFTAVFVLLTLLFFTPALWHLPVAALAAVIMQAVGGLLDFKALGRAWRASRDDGIAAASTFAATLLFAPNIQNGILTGLLLSLAIYLYRDMRPRIALLGLHEDGTYRDAERFDLPHPHPDLVILRFDGALHFINAASFEDAVLKAGRTRPGVKVVLISCAGINSIDATGLEVLGRLLARTKADGQTLSFCGLKKQVIDRLQATGMWPAIQGHATYRNEHQALEALLPALDNPDGKGL
ncbi:MAG: sulfate permease [Rhodocyclaceae bacterium]|nr:sulfate permease [Rhodocyclaceae bacterium]